MRTKPRRVAGPEEREIRTLIKRGAKALEAKDIEGLVAGYAEDVILFDVKPPYRTKGLPAVRKLWEASLLQLPEKLRSEHRDIRVTMEGDLAFAHYLQRIQAVGQTHPASETWTRATVCYQRSDGEWRIVHEHVSVPFDPVTGRVAFIKDLETSSGQE